MSADSTSVTWSYTWSAAGNGSVTIKSRATDDSGNIETPGAGVNVTVNCPCGLFGNELHAVDHRRPATRARTSSA